MVFLHQGSICLDESVITSDIFVRAGVCIASLKLSGEGPPEDLRTKMRARWGPSPLRYGEASRTPARMEQYSNTADFGWKYYMARWPCSAPERQRVGYDPSLGRFLQADTIVPWAGDPASRKNSVVYASLRCRG